MKNLKTAYHINGHDVGVIVIVSSFLYFLTLLFDGSYEFQVPGSSSNPNFAFPISLQGNYFWPESITLCLSDPTLQLQFQNSPQILDCKVVFDKLVFPRESFPSGDVALGWCVACALVLVLRAGLWGVFVKEFGISSHLRGPRLLRGGGGGGGGKEAEAGSAQVEMGDLYANLQRIEEDDEEEEGEGINAVTFLCDMLVESGVRLALVVCIQSALAYFIKCAVRHPRPIAFALKAWCSVDVSLRHHYCETATKSFPSGHASFSLCCGGYLALLLLGDAHCLRSSGLHLCSFAATVLAWLVLLVGLWIGVSRVFDYWHSPADVLGKPLAPGGASCHST
jgi:membrane-associated phospholipid phosphatase